MNAPSSRRRAALANKWQQTPPGCGEQPDKGGAGALKVGKGVGPQLIL